MLNTMRTGRRITRPEHRRAVAGPTRTPVNGGLSVHLAEYRAAFGWQLDRCAADPSVVACRHNGRSSPRRCAARAIVRRDRNGKPVHVDSASWSALPRPAPGHVGFEEVLLFPEDSSNHGEQGQRVTEYVFEPSETDPHD